MSTREPLLVIINPISGGIDKTPIIKLLQDEYQQEPEAMHLFYTKGDNDKNQILRLLKKFNPGRIVVVGGDGTFKMVAEITRGKLPLALFPAGSANGLAENLHLPTNINSQLKVALGCSFLYMDCIAIDGELCLHMSDLGLNAELIQNYEKGEVRGKLGYLLQSIPTLIQSEFPFDFKIKLQEKTIHTKAFLVAVANAKRYGTGATINPEAQLDDGQFEVLVFKRFNIPELLKTFQANYVPQNDFIQIFKTTSATIECEKYIPFQIDGEFRGEKKQMSARIAPIKLKIAVPPEVKNHTQSLN